MLYVEAVEDMGVEIRGKDPPFLAGQTKKMLEFSPLDGSLHRAAP